MHLYTTSASPNGQRVNVFLKEKGLEVPVTEVDIMGGENLGDEFKARNPFGRVPVLELDDGTCISESVSICRFFEGQQPEPNLFGNDPTEAAKIDMWIRRTDISFMMPIAQGFRNTTGIFKDREVCNEERGKTSIEIARSTAVLFNDHLANNEYLLGDRYCVADMLLAITLGFAKRTGQDFFDLEHLKRFNDQIRQRPAIS